MIFAEQHRSGLAAASGGISLLTAVNEPVEKCSGGHDDRRSAHRAAIAQTDASTNAPAFEALAALGVAGGKLLDEQLGNFRLLDLEITLALENLAHLEAVLLLVALGAGRPHGWTARGIQQTELNAHRVGDLAHDAAQGINLAHQMSFGDSAHGRVAGHLRDQVDVESEQRGAQSHARAGHRRLATGVAGADDDYVVLFGI